MPYLEAFSQELEDGARSNHGPRFLPQPGLVDGSPCDHPHCGAFREGRLCGAFFMAKFTAEKPVAATHLINTLAACLNAGMKACLFVELPGERYPSYELVVECKSAVDPSHTQSIARKLETEFRSPGGDRAGGCVVKLFPLCGWQLVTYLTAWATRVTRGGSVDGDWSLYPGLVDMVESAGFETNPLIRDAALLCRQKCDGHDH